MSTQQLNNAPTVEAAHAMGAKGGPTVEAERLAFEAWMHGHCWALCAEWDGTGYRGSAEHGSYLCPRAMNTRQLWAAWRDRAVLAAPQPASTTPEFTRIARQKLERLQAQGWTINGVHIQRAADNGTHRHGAVTSQGMVMWWHGKLDSAPHALSDEQPSADSLCNALAEIRELFPAPEQGGYGELEWMEAMGDPLAVPGYVKTMLAAPQPAQEPAGACVMCGALGHDQIIRQPAQEPVAKITGIDEYGPMLGWNKHWANFPVGTSLYATPQPQPAQEPIGFMSPKQIPIIKDPDDGPGGRYIPMRKTPAGLFTLALYTAPQLQRQPLADEYVQQLIAEAGALDGADDMTPEQCFEWLVRRVEKAHGITEGPAA